MQALKTQAAIQKLRQSFQILRNVDNFSEYHKEIFCYHHLGILLLHPKLYFEVFILLRYYDSSESIIVRARLQPQDCKLLLAQAEIGANFLYLQFCSYPRLQDFTKLQMLANKRQTQIFSILLAFLENISFIYNLKIVI